MMKTVYGFICGCLISAAIIWILVENDIDTLVIEPDAVLPDNTRYYGDIVDGRFHGKGRLISSNGTRYEGDFVDGLVSGQGEIEYGSGEHYKGEFENGYMSGYGVLKGSNGEVYEGEFADNRYDGQGKAVIPLNGTYSGEFVKGNFTGEGKYEDDKGNSYSGGFKNWRFHGKGRYETGNGYIYEGDFIDGRFEGKGKLEDAAKNVYEGEFKDWVLDGKGSFSTVDGEKYTGKFEMGILNGPGEYYGEDGNIYKGEFQDWRYHGEGILTKKDGTIYIGKFEYGYKNGNGTLTYAEPVNGVLEMKGEWKYDEFVDPDAEKKRIELKKNVEKIIYSQTETLNKYLDSLQEGDAGQPELFFLGLAAGGRQDVFIKEVKFIKTSLDQRFNMGDRSILLSNNQATLAELPLVTKTGISSALGVIAQKMNMDEDVLILYITGHGSKEHGISLSNPGFTLAEISADDLADLVHESSIKWKILMISGCYTGGFIPALKDEYTVVMTAARDDRKSFGCSNTSDMTYFGKAYFKEALPESKSFVQAFEKAKLYIKEWEDKDIEENPNNKYSEPQIFIGKEIGNYLKEVWHDI